MNYLFFGDLHIIEKDLVECSTILQEITSMIKQYKVDKLIITGDTFDKLNPTPAEFDLFASFIRDIKIPAILLVANSHESISKDESVLNHFGILNDTLAVVKNYIDENHLFVGHFIVNESKKNYGGSIPKKNLAKYKYVILGHGHSFDEVRPNIIQLGSSRYVDFAEVNDKVKVVALAENYKEDKEKWHFIGLKTPILMKDIIVAKTENEAKKAFSASKAIAFLESCPERMKIRVCFQDFDSYYSIINDLERFRAKFSLFREKKDFLIASTNQFCISTETKTLKESLCNYLKEKKIDEKIINILMEEVK